MSEPLSIKDLYIQELKELHRAESQLLEALPDWAESAYDKSVAEVFANDVAQTTGHVARLEVILEGLREKPLDLPCAAIAQILAHGKEQLAKTASSPSRDEILIGVARKVEDYEIAGYTSVRNLASLLKDNQAVELLTESQKEESKSHSRLLDLAETLRLATSTI